VRQENVGLGIVRKVNLRNISSFIEIKIQANGTGMKGQEVVEGGKGPNGCSL